MTKELGHISDLNSVQSMDRGILHQRSVVANERIVAGTIVIGTILVTQHKHTHTFYSKVNTYMLLEEPIILLDIHLVQHTESLPVG